MRNGLMEFIGRPEGAYQIIPTMNYGNRDVLELCGIPKELIGFQPGSILKIVGLDGGNIFDTRWTHIIWHRFQETHGGFPVPPGLGGFLPRLTLLAPNQVIIFLENAFA